MATNTIVQTINNDKLLKLGERSLGNYEKKQKGFLMCYKRRKNDPEFLQRRREQKQVYYQNTKDKINQHRSNNCKINEDYQENQREHDRKYYSEKRHLM